jgi:superfamily II DNA/RNA helicase
MLTLAHWAVGDLLAAIEVRAGFFTGAEKARRRTQNIVEFHDDPSLRMLFASDAGGVGLNLQRASNCVINMELPWNPAVFEQRIGRIYRLGQKSPIDVYNLVCEYGIESRIASLVGAKHAFFKGLFDGDSDAVQFEQAGSFIDRMKRLIDVPKLAADLEPAEALEQADAAEVSLDDEVADPYEPLVEAADEAQDQPVSRSEEPPAAVTTETESPAQRAQKEGPGFGSASAGEVRRLFSQLEIRQGPEGQVLIEAPPEAASTLGALFEGMAAMLQAAANSPK